MDVARQAIVMLKRAKAPAVGAVLNRLRVEEEYGPESYQHKSYLQGRRALLPERVS